MGISRRNMAGIVALVTWLGCLGLLWKHNVGAESSRIIDGSNVTYFYQITAPSEAGFEVRKIGQFIQGRHQLPPIVERAVTGMKPGDKKNVELSGEDVFGPYDAKKQTAVPKSDLPPGTKEGDVLADRAGRSNRDPVVREVRGAGLQSSVGRKVPAHEDYDLASG